ncbi:MAG: DUF1961 family protein [Cyclobacteriaceae bacterium]|nr:DUF1961 family protein [Cyclobacteriaceae bacterium]
MNSRLINQIDKSKKNAGLHYGRLWVMMAFFFIIFSGCHYERKPKVLYENDFSSAEKMEGWQMEGPGIVEFAEGWMHMYAPEQAWHHVYWCPVDFPESFEASWEMQNMHPEAGLCIIFFAALGTDGEDIFDPSLPARDGTFSQYTKDKINSYHISYYANNPKNQEREAAHLRKNNMFEIVQQGPEGITKSSVDIHKIRLVKEDARIVFYVDDVKIIDWTDDGTSLGPVYGKGKIGFRQMQWTHFRYRNFRVSEVRNKSKA